MDKQRTAKSEFFSKRAALEQFVGNDAFVQFEAELAARENGEPKPVKSESQHNSEIQNQEYSQTIQNVENYTNNLEAPDLRVNEDETISDSTQNEENIALNEEAQDEVLTGSSSNIDDDETQDKKSGLFKRNKKEKVKEPKYSTKGLIFLHNNTDENQIQEKSGRKKICCY